MQHRRASGKDPPILRAQTGQVWVPAKERLGYAAVSNKGSLWPSTHTRARTCTWAHTPCMPKHARMHTCAHICTCACMQRMQKHARTCTRLYTHMCNTRRSMWHMHTHAHVHMHIYFSSIFLVHTGQPCTWHFGVTQGPGSQNSISTCVLTFTARRHREHAF